MCRCPDWLAEASLLVTSPLRLMVTRTVSQTTNLILRPAHGGTFKIWLPGSALMHIALSE